MSERSKWRRIIETQGAEIKKLEKRLGQVKAMVNNARKHYEEREERCDIEFGFKNETAFRCQRPIYHSGPHKASGYTNIGPGPWNLSWSYGPPSDPTPTAFDKAWKQDKKKLTWYSKAGIWPEIPWHSSDIETYRAGWQALWKIMSEWGCSASGPEPINLNAFRAALHKYKA